MGGLGLLVARWSPVRAAIAIACSALAYGGFAVLATSAGAAGCQNGSVAFSFTGAEQCYTIPTGVNELSISAVGAKGGNGYQGGYPSGLGGFGALASGLLPVTPGETLYVEVGGAGTQNGGPTFGGGGGAITYGGSGGGASDIRTVSSSQTSTFSSRLLVAGGGGGGGLYGPTPGGNLAGGNGGAGVAGPTGDGSAGGNGAAWDSSAQAGGGGGGASLSAGGAPGSGGFGGTANGAPGGAGVFGAAGSGSDGAGGGGGGYFGGGGGGGAGQYTGGTSNDLAGAGGGGAGSSFAAPFLADVSFQTDTTGIARVVITPVAPPTASITALASGGSYLPGQSVPTTFSCVESIGGPGLASCDDSNGASSGGSARLDTLTPGLHTYTVTATSKDGQSGRATISYTVAALPTASISLPVSGATYMKGQWVQSAFFCAEGDGGPGLKSCADGRGTSTAGGGSGQLDTSTPGPHTYTVTATSKDGDVGTATISYRVLASAPPTVSIETGRALVANGRAKIMIFCGGGPAGSVCHGALSLTTRNSIVIGSARFTTATGSSHPIVLRLTPSGLRALARAPHHRLSGQATTRLNGARTARRGVLLQLKQA